jgi:hypothetical protein
MRLTKRLRRLEQKLPGDAGCPACRHRKHIVMIDCQRQRDGSVVPVEPEPAPRGACGRVGEFIVRPYKSNLCPEDDRVMG